jgi:hypothetical protein
MLLSIGKKGSLLRATSEAGKNLESFERAVNRPQKKQNVGKDLIDDCSLKLSIWKSVCCPLEEGSSSC